MTKAFSSSVLGPSARSSPNLEVETDTLATFGSLVQRLSGAMTRLEELTQPLKLPPLEGREWYDLLIRKLLPQLGDSTYLVVAVVGGTNIGKSVIFNHIAGFRASASSPLASGTKHPVCLIPDGFDSRHDLKALFPAFDLRRWGDSEEALTSHTEHCLFWRTSPDVPENLVILDTPDVDSDAPVNWQRADAVRQAADVLVAVLTQQKYNDAAVKQFFRKAADEDKAAIVVFNQVELPDDEPYWPLWLKTFCSETGLRPEYVYLAPNDRKSAEAIALNFAERTWPSATNPTDSTATSSAGPAGPSTPVRLNQVLSQLRFTEIKLRTLRGSLKRLVALDDGAPAYLQEIRQKSLQFREAATIFASRSLIQKTHWPAPPNSLLVDEMWRWWNSHREVWTSSVHGVYAHIGRWVNGGVRVVRDRIWGQSVPPLDEYRRAEWEAIVQVLEQVFNQLDLITTLGNELLTERLDRVLSGTSRETVLERLRKEHNEFDFEKLVQSLVETELSALRTDRAQLFNIIRNADRAAAIVRPVLTVLLAFGGVFGAEHILVNAASQSLTHVAVDATVAAGTTVAGNAAVDSATGVLSQVKAWLLQLHHKFKLRREEWLTNRLSEYLLGGLVDELHAGAIIPNSAAFQEAEELIRQFSAQQIRLLAGNPIDETTAM
ncbi:GTPase [Schlesneria sp. DSM 10557]|uniref:GTPase n=1 Tax=Schlesneria sp. DSM 10557 TaxID=3044399 RepID=UPI00359FEC4A